MLLAASYIFYGSWDYRFLSLILLSTIVDYLCGLRIYRSNNPSERNALLAISVVTNLGLLGFFKYFNFFTKNLQLCLGLVGISLDMHTLSIILPIGISFYTFQTMSYTIDIYRRELVPTRDFLDFALFVSFFPQLVAGPIERATRLLPQIASARVVTGNLFCRGCRMVFWGAFLKMFVADNLARIVDPVFASTPPYEGARVVLASYAFAFQIFCDFAGYSIIARGVGRCMGFDIMCNFRQPYFATNPVDFWQRWHISLSSWLRDYLYIPLGGNRKGRIRTYRNVLLTMLVGGLWHGAAWSFVIWGAYHALLIIAFRLLQDHMPSGLMFKRTFLARIWRTAKTLAFFNLVCLGWMIFRASSFAQISEMAKSIVFNFDLGIENIRWQAAACAFYTAILIVVQGVEFRTNSKFEDMYPHPLVLGLVYSLCFYMMWLYGVHDGKAFIYFQF